MQNLKNVLFGGLTKTRIMDVLAACVGAVLCVGLAGYFWIDTSAPANLGGDHTVVLTMAKSYINGHGFRFDSQMGFPGVRDWLYFPSFELIQRSLLWLSGHVTHSPFRSVHALYMAGLAAMFGFAYWVLRRFGVRMWIAAIGALASVLTPFLASRGYGHDFLVLSFSVPLGLGLALSLGTDRWNSDLKAFLRDPLTLTTVLVVSTSGLYYTFYTLMFLAFTACAMAAAQRKVFPILAALCAMAPMGVLLLFSGYGFDLIPALSGKFSLVHRLPYEQILYGLDVPSAALRLGFLPEVAKGLASTTAYLPDAFAREGFNEWPALPLTLILLAAPLVAAVCLQRRRDEDDAISARLQLIGLCAIYIVFALLFGFRGGLGFIFNLVVTPEIRADARLMPFLTFAAIIIVCAAAEMTTAMRPSWIRIGGPILAAVALAVSIRPSLGVLAKFQKTAMATPAYQATRAGAVVMLKAKDKAGLRRILELPVAPWPESPAIYNFDPYQHQIPYLMDAPKSDTKWSYGISATQPWFGQINLLANQLAGLQARAKSLGFDGVLIQKNGYDPAALPPLQAELEGAGGRCRLYEDAAMVLYAVPHDGSSAC
jgi:phosphoglycerol transferase